MSMNTIYPILVDKFGYFKLMVFDPLSGTFLYDTKSRSRGLLRTKDESTCLPLVLGYKKGFWMRLFSVPIPGTTIIQYKQKCIRLLNCGYLQIIGNIWEYYLTIIMNNNMCKEKYNIVEILNITCIYYISHTQRAG